MSKMEKKIIKIEYIFRFFFMFAPIMLNYRVKKVRDRQRINVKDKIKMLGNL